MLNLMSSELLKVPKFVLKAKSNLQYDELFQCVLLTLDRSFAFKVHVKVRNAHGFPPHLALMIFVENAARFSDFQTEILFQSSLVN